VSLKLSSHYFALLLALVSVAASAASDGCPYSLLRFRSGQAERIGLVAKAELRTMELPVTLAHDITSLLEALGKMTPVAVRQAAFVSPKVQREIASWACETKNLEQFRENHPHAKLVAIKAEDILPPETIGPNLELSGARGVLPSGLGLLIRSNIKVGTEIAAQNVQEHVSGALLGSRFIPLEFLGGANNEAFRTDAAQVLRRYLERREVFAGDVLKLR